MSLILSSSLFCSKRGGLVAVFAILVVVYVIATSYLSSLVVHGNYNGPGDFKSPQIPDKARHCNTTALRPKLSSILNFTSGQIIGDPNSLLDFAIIGFPKCGTTALHLWLGQHPQIHLLENEVFSLLNKAPDRLIFRLYTQLPSNETYKRGYKNPLDIRVPHSLAYIRRFFPKTLLMIGIRHPVKWFESLYNFKVQNLPRKVSPSYWGDPNGLIGACMQWNDTNCVGTAKGLFHVHLAALGKVLPLSTQLVHRYPQILSNVSHMPNPVFLYVSEQLTHQDTAHSKTFRYDLLRLLGLLPTSTSETTTNTTLMRQRQKEFINLLPDVIPRSKPDFEHFSQREQSRRNRNKIDLCQERYVPVRTELMNIAKEASVWIRTSGFLSSPSVTVSSPDYFMELLLGWMTDPCMASTSIHNATI
jgi:hypothetical protein